MILLGHNYRYRPRGVFGKGVGNSKNASEIRQKCVKHASKWVFILLGNEERSKMRQRCVKIASKMLRGRAPFGRHFYKHLSSVLGQTELRHEVRNPGPQKPQIIRNESRHLALLEIVRVDFWENCQKRPFVHTQRARILKKAISLDRLKTSSFRLKFSISLDIFGPDLENSPTKIWVWWVARLKFSISLENVIRFNLA